MKTENVKKTCGNKENSLHENKHRSRQYGAHKNAYTECESEYPDKSRQLFHFPYLLSAVFPDYPGCFIICCPDLKCVIFFQNKNNFNLKKTGKSVMMNKKGKNMPIPPKTYGILCAASGNKNKSIHIIT